LNERLTSLACMSASMEGLSEREREDLVGSPARWKGPSLQTTPMRPGDRIPYREGLNSVLSLRGDSRCYLQAAAPAFENKEEDFPSLGKEGKGGKGGKAAAPAVSAWGAPKGWGPRKGGVL
jgi:hypothetical protein